MLEEFAEPISPIWVKEHDTISNPKSFPPQQANSIEPTVIYVEEYQYLGRRVSTYKDNNIHT